MATEQSVGQPDWAVPPGETLAEALSDRGMSQSELARRMDRPVKTINEIVNGKTAITSDTAIQLERALGISASFWNGLEAQYRERLAWARAEQELEANASWADDFPIRDLMRHNVITSSASKTGKVAALLSFFRVSSPSAWERQWLAPSAAFRASPSFASAPKAVATWLRWGEVEAENVDNAPFNPARFRKVLKEIRGLTRREPLMQIIARVQELCESAGVVVVLTPELTGARLSGAARWLTSDTAIIQLSLRYKTDDQLWFSFFHEAGHLLEDKRRDYLHTDEGAENASQADEDRADTFARNLLVPPDPWASFVDQADFSEEAVRQFAKAQGIGAGIVVGRLQREDHLDRSHLNGLKKAIDWPTTLR
jgi:addiction module HigA family antidote